PKTGSNVSKEPETGKERGEKETIPSSAKASAALKTDRQPPGAQPQGRPIAAVVPAVKNPANGITTAPGQTTQHTKEQSDDAKNLIAHLQFDVLPRLIQEIDKISGTAIHWDVDWVSFHNSPAALRALEQEGLNEIREALQEYALEHTRQALGSTVK